MLPKALRLFLGALAAAAIAMVAAPANAVVYGSGFDPLTFHGTGFFEFDDACLSVDGTHTAASCHAAFLGAMVDMTQTPPIAGDTGHLSFTEATPDFADVVDIVIAGGTLVGVDTLLIGPVFPSPCTGALCGTPWWIEWLSPAPLLLALSDPVTLTTGTCVEGCFPNTGPAGTALHVTFTQVPEPGTLGLFFGGVGAAWLARRRKKAA